MNMNLYDTISQKVGDALRRASKLITLLAEVQTTQRTEFREALTAISNKYERAFERILEVLRQIKSRQSDPSSLKAAIQDLQSGSNKDRRYIRERLCHSEVCELVDRLQSWLDPLTYSVDIGRLKDIRQRLSETQDKDNQYHDDFENMLRALDRCAYEYQHETDEAAAQFQARVHELIEAYERHFDRALRHIRATARRIRF